MQELIFIRLHQGNNILESNIEWLVTDHHGKIIEFTNKSGLFNNLIQLDLSSKKLILIIPDQMVSYHLAHIPIKDAKKRQQAVGYILEEKILSNIENTVFSIGHQIAKDRYLVAVADKNKLENILAELKNNFNLIPSTVLTDALCLFKNPDLNDQNNHKLYLNQDNNLFFIINNTVTLAKLDNLDLLLESYETNLNVDIYKHQIENIGQLLPKNFKKLNIKTEQIIVDWLPFLVTSWFSNRKYNKTDLSANLIKRKGLGLGLGLELKFNKLWPYIASVWIITFGFFVAYKYFDNNIFSARLADLDNLTKSTLNSINISTSSLENADKLIDRQISNIDFELKKQRVNDEFFILLSVFAENFSQIFKMNSAKFLDHNLEISFDINKNDNKYLDNIKKDLAKHSISLQEKYTEKDADYSNAIWNLKLIK
ncbi:MAG: hypothetical protein KBD64_04790 [Gammaproteobacteria bacterium]|nr:hypothetical protein [Gammaproteobacteria bacterium]